MGERGLLRGKGVTLIDLPEHKGGSPAASKPLRGSLKDVSGYTVSSPTNQHHRG